MHLPPKKRQLGFTLIEVGIAAVLSAAIAALLLSVEANNLRQQVATDQGQLLNTLNNAVNAYEATNFAALVNHTAVAGVANEYSPTVTELSSLGYLSNPYSTQNLYGGGYSIVLSLQPAGCVTVNCNVGGLVALTTPILNNEGVADTAAAGQAMIAAGGDAAMSSTVTPGTVAGVNGSWIATNPMGNVSGIVAMRNGYLSSNYAPFLRRDGSLAMTGSLSLGGNNLTNANSVSANSVSATAITGTTVTAGNVNTTALTASTGSINTLNTGQLSGTNAYLTNISSNSVSNTGNVTTNTLNSNSISSTGRIATSEYLQIGGTASIGAGCSPSGLIAQDGSGGLLSCQSGVWARFQTFDRFQTIESTVDWYCTQGDPTNPPNYNYAQWSITCGSRFCEANGYQFGLVTEFSGVGGNANQPYESSPSGGVTVSCSR